MNFVFLSPHFPENYYLFGFHLNELGVNVLGLADEPYELLQPKLRACLGEYYQVHDMHSYDQLLRACGYFTHRYGKIDRMESFNEYWLETEAALRTDFNISGINLKDIEKIKRKSLMKKVFTQAGVPSAQGRVVRTLAEAKKLATEIGFPIVAKPDIGVGAAKTFKINNPNELSQFFTQKADVDYIFEEYILGQIYTFDGLTDMDGNLVFFTSHTYSQGIMEVVNQDDDVYYYSLRDIPEELEHIGRQVLKAFQVRERFFHFEFFQRKELGDFVALEVNMRPPGGLTTDMFNYANNIDIYKEWAHILVHNRFTAQYSRPYHCCYVGRKNKYHYIHSHETILEEFGDCCISHHQAISGVFSAALGDYGYLVRSPELNDIFAMADFIQSKE